MRDCHMGVTAFVTRDVTGESQHPVPARPNPARPALYRSAWSPEHHSVALVTRASAAGVVAGPVDEMMKCPTCGMSDGPFVADPRPVGSRHPMASGCEQCGWCF